MIPNARERKTLRDLMFSEWENVASLYSAGAQTIAGMLEKRWIEMLQTPPSGLERCKITQAGKDAYAAPVEKPPARRPLKMLAPRLKTADPSTVKPLRRS